MPAKPLQVIIDEIAAHINKQGGPRSNWYVGITADIEQRLHSDHAVPKKNHWFSWREAFTADDARSIEQAFLEWGCSGGPGGGDHRSRFVYAYLKTAVTVE
jgi:hypothetical protein